MTQDTLTCAECGAELTPRGDDVWLDNQGGQVGFGGPADKPTHFHSPVAE